MFPLPAGSWPSTVEQLRQQLLEGLRAVLGVSPRLTLSGEWPGLSEIALDLSGVRIDLGAEWPVPKPATARKDGPACRQLRFWGSPLLLGDVAQPQLDLRASNLQFEFIRDESDRHWLKPVAVGGGTICAGITESELNGVFLLAARRYARNQGITIDDTKIRLEHAGANSIRVEAEVGARKSFLKGRLRFAGAAEIRSDFSIRLHELRCEGMGPVGAIAARAVQPYLQRLDQVVHRPLGSLVSGLSLEHLQLKEGAHGFFQVQAGIAASGVANDRATG